VLAIARLALQLTANPYGIRQLAFQPVAGAVSQASQGEYASPFQANAFGWLLVTMNEADPVSQQRGLCWKY